MDPADVRHLLARLLVDTAIAGSDSGPQKRGIDLEAGRNAIELLELLDRTHISRIVYCFRAGRLAGAAGVGDDKEHRKLLTSEQTLRCSGSIQI